MTQYDINKAIAWFEAKWGARPCSQCGVIKWAIQDRIFELREFHGGSLVVSAGYTLPLVVAVCSNCGNTVLVNAILLGAYEQPAKPTNEKVQSAKEGTQ